jgi:hypothetical protein
MNLLPDNKNGFSAEFEGGPIPGQSLARAPGSYPFEQPPQFVDPQAAFESLVNAISEPKVTGRLLDMLELGVPVYSVVYTTLMTGFAEGKWSPDVALLLAEPFAMLLFKLADEAGIDATPGVEEEEDDLMEMVAQKREAEAPMEEPEAPLGSAPSMMEPI